MTEDQRKALNRLIDAMSDVRNIIDIELGDGICVPDHLEAFYKFEYEICTSIVEGVSSGQECEMLLDQLGRVGCVMEPQIWWDGVAMEYDDLRQYRGEYAPGHLKGMVHRIISPEIRDDEG